MPRRPGRLRLIALGAALAYFFDPAQGKERRKGVVKRLAQLSERFRHEQPAGDAELARKVETEILGAAPEAKIDVNAENGRIVLRGEVDSPELIDDLVARAQKVHGVEGVESLLRTP